MLTESKSGQRQVLTPRLELRAANLEDVSELYECFHDPEVMRYWDSLPHATERHTSEWVEKMIKSAANGVTDFVIVLKNELRKKPLDSGNDISSVDELPSKEETQHVERVIGKAGIWQDNEIGFLLNRSYWGKGLAVEALTALIDLAFGLDSSGTKGGDDGGTYPEDIVADVDPRNEASLGLLEKLGFEVYATKEKTFQIGDVWVDSVYLRLKKQSWIDRKKK